MAATRLRLQCLSLSLLCAGLLTSFATPLISAEHAPLAASPCTAFNGKSWNADPQTLPDSDWRTIDVGEWKVIANICPQARYFPSGLILTPGATYQISATGFWQDGFLPPVGARGWNGLLLMAANRIPWRPMFYLSGSIGRSENKLIPLGEKYILETPDTLPQIADRKLYLFANDIDAQFFYNNNREVRNSSDRTPLRVSIHRIR